jgi:hypothetical protein
VESGLEQNVQNGGHSGNVAASFAGKIEQIQDGVPVIKDSKAVACLSSRDANERLWGHVSWCKCAEAH